MEKVINQSSKRVFALIGVMAMLLSMLIPGMNHLVADAATHQDTGSLTIVKYEMLPEDLKNNPNGEQIGPSYDRNTITGETVAGVTYDVKQVEAFDGIDWTDVAEADAAKYTMTTGADGTIKREGIPTGRYEVKEVSGPDHIILNTEIFSIDIPMTYNGGKDISYDVTIYPKNEKVQGDAEIAKKGDDGKPLAGVTFGLFNADGTQIGENLITDSQGKVSASGLPAGDYYFQEIETVEGYAINTSKINFTVRKTGDGPTGKTEIVWTTVGGFTGTERSGSIEVLNFKEPSAEKSVEGGVTSINRDEVFTYDLTFDIPKNIDQYTKLAIWDELDDRLEYANDWRVTGWEGFAIDFNKTGQRLEWTIKSANFGELKGTEKFVISFDAKIKADAVVLPEEQGIPNVAHVDFDNGNGAANDKKPTNTVYVEPNEGDLQIIKVDKADNNIFLSGAEFKLTHDKEGKNVVNAADTAITVNGKSHTGLLENLVTDAKGEINIKGLTPKTYYLHETKAPTYEEDEVTKSYRLLTKPIEIDVTKVNDGSGGTSITVENAKSGFNLPTVGGLGGLAVLAGAAILVVKGRGKE